MGKIVVTGGFGFIGQNLVKGLNNIGRSDIIIVDDPKYSLRCDCPELKFEKVLSISDFLLLCLHNSNKVEKLGDDIDVVFHMGAISNTLDMSERVIYYNTTFSETLANYCNYVGIPLFYASSAAVYGNSKKFSEELWDLHPLNLYGISKLLFDKAVRINNWPNIFGFRFFNVYGPREFHKSNMASSLLQFYSKLRVLGKTQLFKSIDRMRDGEQLRDFIHVDRVVDALLTFYSKKDEIPAGIYNVGTGSGTTYNCIAFEAIQHILNGKLEGAQYYSTDNHIEYVAMPPKMKVSYQSMTIADMTKTNKYWLTTIQDAIDPIADINKYYSYLDSFPIEVFENFLLTLKVL